MKGSKVHTNVLLCTTTLAYTDPLTPSVLFSGHWLKYIFWEKITSIYFFSYVLYKVCSLDICHIIHSSLLAIICIFLAFNGGSLLQHFAHIPTAHYNFKVLRNVTINFLKGNTNSSLFQNTMCIFPSNGSQMTINDVNFDVLKIGHWSPYVIVCEWFIISVI